MAALDDRIADTAAPAADSARRGEERRGQVVRTAIILALAALAVYGGFILLMAERSQG
jgi:hypothetical protein